MRIQLFGNLSADVNGDFFQLAFRRVLVAEEKTIVRNISGLIIEAPSVPATEFSPAGSYELRLEGSFLYTNVDGVLSDITGHISGLRLEWPQAGTIQKHRAVVDFRDPVDHFISDLPTTYESLIDAAMRSGGDVNTHQNLFNWLAFDNLFMDGTPFGDRVIGHDTDDEIVIGDYEGRPDNDFYFASKGNDFAQAGDGWDLFSARYLDSGIDIDLNSGVANHANGKTTFTGFDRVEGSSSADFIRLLDTEEPGAPEPVFLSEADGGFPTEDDVERNFDAKGGGGADVIQGGARSELLLGGAGNDTITGGPGHDAVYGDSGADSLVGLSGEDVIFGDEGADKIYGGDDDDRLYGEGDTDEIFGDGGNDYIGGGRGRDTLEGNAGDDALDGGADADSLVGGEDNDTLNGDDGADTLIGGAGNDSIQGGDGGDTLRGGDGADTLMGGYGNDYIEGGEGNDVVIFENPRGHYVIGRDFDDGEIIASYSSHEEGTMLDGFDTLIGIERARFADGEIDLTEMEPTLEPISGTPDPDVLNGTTGGDTLLGFANADRLIGDAGNDSLDGGTGADTLNGGDGNDTILGGPADDDLRDVIYAGDGNDTVDGGAGNDLIYGQGGNDTIAGGAGVDELQGQDGDDVITGSAFSDLVFGGAGDDFVNGGFGHDRINGGSGADKFFHAGVLGHGSDWVQDYRAPDGDVLLWGGHPATAGDFQVNLAHTENDVGERSGDDAVLEAFVIYRPTEQILWALVDGGGQSSINIQIGGDVFDLLA